MHPCHRLRGGLSASFSPPVIVREPTSQRLFPHLSSSFCTLSVTDSPQKDADTPTRRRCQAQKETLSAPTGDADSAASGPGGSGSDVRGQLGDVTAGSGRPAGPRSAGVDDHPCTLNTSGRGLVDVSLHGQRGLRRIRLPFASSASSGGALTPSRQVATKSLALDAKMSKLRPPRRFNHAHHKRD